MNVQLLADSVFLGYTAGQILIAAVLTFGAVVGIRWLAGR